jgi:ABC-2 type transport system permease protein
LATSVSRSRWYFSWLGFTTLASGVLLAVSGLGVGLGAVTGDAGAGTLAEVTVGTLAFLPAVLVVAAVAGALFGIRPATSTLAWILVTYAVLFGMFGALLNLPGWVTELSPFAHITAMPLGGLSPAPLVVLSLMAAVLALAASTAFRRRDLDIG